jgi:Skp family chaperone for outer membrane proteins
MHRSLALLALPAALVLLSAGCNQGGGTAASGGVAVIDLDLVAARLGSDRLMAESITRRQATLSQQLAALANSYREQIAEKKNSAPPAPQKDEVTLATFEQQASQSLGIEKQKAEAQLSAHRAQLVQQFRDQIRPVARKVALERGLSVIVTKNDSVVFDYPGAVDITESVIASFATPAPSVAAGPSQQPK